MIKIKGDGNRSITHPTLCFLQNMIPDVHMAICKYSLSLLLGYEKNHIYDTALTLKALSFDTI